MAEIPREGLLCPRRRTSQLVLHGGHYYRYHHNGHYYDHRRRVNGRWNYY